jgi:NAD(P)-dependent dehydrogenase (short-subunit alcohol dehydrogenase family)
MNNNGKWTAANIGDLAGKVMVVTGANSGIGWEATKVFVEKGAHVVMACRSIAKGELAQRDLSGSSQVVHLNLASLASVRTFADDFKAKHDKLDLLVNNAGVMAIPYRKTEDGFEMQFGTNHLGHFALTGLLLEPLLATNKSRVVSVSSMAHTRGTMRWDDLVWESDYNEWTAYGMSKLANLLFAYELQRQFEAAGVDALSVACHPGYAATNLQAIQPERLLTRLLNMVMKVTNRVLAQSAAMGALPTLYAALADEVNGGDYIGPANGMRGYPAKVQSNDKSRHREDAAKLWTISEQLTAVQYDELG